MIELILIKQFIGTRSVPETKNSLSKSSGFTLIELLVAMAVASIVMAMIGSAYWGQTQTSREQQMVVGMQQNMRAAMFLLERDIMMAGYDEDRNNLPAAAVTEATATNFTFQFVDDANTGVTVAYSLYDAGGDGDDDIGRRINPPPHPPPNPPRYAIAENIENLEFFYTLADGRQSTDPTTLAPPGNTLADIRAVGISILARTSAETRARDNATYLPLSNAQDGTIWGPFNDGFRRQLIVATIMCRNLINR